MKKIYVSLYILLQIIVVGTAQQSTITVLDEDNKGLPFVNIHLLELDKYLHTDMDGKAIIVFGKFDSLQLEVTSIGYHKVNAVVYPNKDLVVSLKTNVVTLGGVVITGDRIFIIKLADGTYQKLIIEMLQGGVYTFKYADLDGENEVSASLTKSDYDGKNFGYYSIQNNTVLDREPVSPEWDLLFTKYVVDLGGGFLYGVSGVLANVNVQVAQANGVADV
ncbi:MAG TPA: hypothetical protein EYG86_00025, partial [Crocinitomicaceae bacterium]|nr:hypothetical protein [Crocinitomicaceae bacterium]